VTAACAAVIYVLADIPAVPRRRGDTENSYKISHIRVSAIFIFISISVFSRNKKLDFE
jgi:hypothetical protein